MAARTASASNGRVAPEAEPVEHVVQPSGKIRVASPTGGDRGHDAQSERDGSPMRESIAGLDLERVADGVAKVQRAPLTRFEGIALADGQLHAGTALENRVARRLVIAEAGSTARPRSGATARDHR